MFSSRVSEEDEACASYLMILKHRAVALESTQIQEGINGVISDVPMESNKISVPLSMSEDAKYLSEAHCLLRSKFCEFFAATEESNMNHNLVGTGSSLKSGGRRGKISSGRVGIRCCFCRSVPLSSRANQAIPLL